MEDITKEVSKVLLVAVEEHFIKLEEQNKDQPISETKCPIISGKVDYII